MTHVHKALVVAGHGMVGHHFVQDAIERGQIRPETSGEPVVLGATIPVGSP